MKIAQIAPLAESVPPKLYGGTERIVSYLTEQLVALGHDVTLFASGDSVTTAELVPCADTALRLNPAITDPLPYHVFELEEVRQRAADFDILHFHIDLLHFPLVRPFAERTLTTLHNRHDGADYRPLYMAFPEIPLVSISDSQRRAMPPVNWIGTVYNGIPANLLPFHPAPTGDYLAFLGRIAPEKGPAEAIEIARRAGMPLKMAAKIDKVDKAYWDSVIKPLIRRSPWVEFVGEIGEDQKPDFLGNATALLFPIDWPEPFGLVMIEAMACGTPVIGFSCGSVPEVLEEGISGFIVKDLDEAVEAVGRIGTVGRAGVRSAFERRFSAERMAADYLALYRYPEPILVPEPAATPLARTDLWPERATAS